MSELLAALTAVRRYERREGLVGVVSLRRSPVHWKNAAAYYRGLAARYRRVGVGDGHSAYAVRWAMSRHEEAVLFAEACSVVADRLTARW